MMEKIIVDIYPQEYAMSNKTRMPEELFAELSTLATFFDKECHQNDRRSRFKL
jgi:hypothetical protein